jgi:glycosyltransferase involved in cell wall biosynthesis
MKLFFVVGSFKMGGTERTASRIGLELLKRGHTVKFILINPIFDYNEPELVANSIVLVPDKRRKKAVRLLVAFFTLVKLLRREKPDYLISFSIGINLFIVFTLYRRIIFRIESNIFIYKKKLYRRYLQKLASLVPQVKKIVIPSKGLYDQCRSYFYAPKKLILVSNPINIGEVKALSDADIADVPALQPGRFIVTAGRLHASKGFVQLINVFSQSTLKGTYKLVILGEGPERGVLEKLIADKALQDDVLLLGYQSNPYRFFAKSRFFVLNSKHESFGNVLIETMACDVPVVSNDCDFGPRHIIKQNRNGVLYDRNDEKAFSEVLNRVAFDDNFYRQLKDGVAQEKGLYDIATITQFWTDSVITR